MNMSGSTHENDNSLAKERWKLLGQMLLKKNCQVKNNTVSGRCFTSFGLMTTDILCNELCGDDDQEKDTTQTEKKNKSCHLWYRYKCHYKKCYTADIRHLDTSINIQDLLGFNNTGNVCVWPSEEVLTYYCIKNMHNFSGKKLCELGGGMTCMAGIFLALHCDIEEMLLTDGNAQSVENVHAILKQSKKEFGKLFIHARVLLWNECDTFSDLKGHFDTVICADCLFFDEYRQDLVNLLDYILSAQGEAIIFAPKRGETFKQFQLLAEKVFQVTCTENYDQHIWNLHLQNKSSEGSVYNEDIHYPLMLHLKRM